MFCIEIPRAKTSNKYFAAHRSDDFFSEVWSAPSSWLLPVIFNFVRILFQRSGPEAADIPANGLLRTLWTATVHMGTGKEADLLNLATDSRYKVQGVEIPGVFIL